MHQDWHGTKPLTLLLGRRWVNTRGPRKLVSAGIRRRRPGKNARRGESLDYFTEGIRRSRSQGAAELTRATAKRLGKPRILSINHVICQYQGIHVGAQETTDRLAGRPHDRFVLIE